MDLDYLRLDCHPDNVIEIREGQTVDSPLIAKWDKDSSHYQTIITATSSILVQLNFTGGHGPMECITGFIASLRTGDFSLTKTNRQINSYFLFDSSKTRNKEAIYVQQDFIDWHASIGHFVFLGGCSVRCSVPGDSV